MVVASNAMPIRVVVYMINALQTLDDKLHGIQ